MRRSLALDGAILRAHRLPRTTRGAFVLRKYAALARIATGRPATITVPGLRFTARSASEVGTLQSANVDTHGDLVVPSLCTGRAAVIDVGADAGTVEAVPVRRSHQRKLEPRGSQVCSFR